MREIGRNDVRVGTSDPVARIHQAGTSPDAVASAGRLADPEVRDRIVARVEQYLTGGGVVSSVGGDDVLVAVLALLRDRMPDRLLALNAQAPTVDDQGTPVPVLLDPVRSWRLLADFDERADGQLPQVSVDSPGWSGAPGRRATDGSGRLSWTVVVTVLQRGRTRTQTSVRTQRYVTAALDAVLAAGTVLVAGRESDVQPVATAYDEVERDSRRTLGAGFVELEVSVPGALAGYDDLTGEAAVPVTRASVLVRRRTPQP